MSVWQFTTMTTVRSELQKQAFSATIQYALFRWESAVVIALTIVLSVVFRKPFIWWPPFGWLLIGLIGLGAIVYSSLTDAETNARVLLKLFQEQFDPREINDKELRQSIENALEYQRRIEVLIRRQSPGVMRDRLEDTANQISQWIANIYQLALRLDAYRADDLLARERQALPKEIEQLTNQRRLESDVNVQAQLDSVLEGKAKHWQTLRALDARMKQASLQMEQSLTALATIYSQVQLVDAQSVASGRAERLQADIQEQVARLNDLVNSINEVYNFQTKSVGSGNL
jgi:hypothetical protein